MGENKYYLYNRGSRIDREIRNVNQPPMLHYLRQLTHLNIQSKTKRFFLNLFLYYFECANPKVLFMRKTNKITGLEKKKNKADSFLISRCTFVTEKIRFKLMQHQKFALYLLLIAGRAPNVLLVRTFFVDFEQQDEQSCGNVVGKCL